MWIQFDNIIADYGVYGVLFEFCLVFVLGFREGGLWCLNGLLSCDWSWLLDNCSITVRLREEVASPLWTGWVVPGRRR